MRRFRNLMFCVILAVNCLHGVPMRPDEIEELMAAMKQPKIAHLIADEDYVGDD